MTTTDKTLDSNYSIMERWISDGETWIGIFENRDLSHQDLGQRIALSFDVDVWDLAVEGETRMPDHKDVGLGWRYILVKKTRSAKTATDFLSQDETKTTH